jgi:hypothetical protein
MDIQAFGLRIFYESEIEGREHQDNTDIHRQPFPESILEEQKIQTNNNGDHYQNVKHGRYIDFHFNA